MERKARVIAYYLPQFHPIPENDLWWGKGFTEWTNVGKSKPLFKGHYQPRVPADLGYYDLRMPEVRQAQAQMAREAGVEGFMYWHYWFGDGKRILERPFNEILDLGEPDFPFCLGWANHSWTNHSWNPSSQWSGQQTLIEQKYLGKDDYTEHFYFVLRAFKDKRYICVDGKPLFLIYSPLDCPDMEYFMSLWRDLAKSNGLKGIHFVGMLNGGKKYFDQILKMSFDSFNAHYQWIAESKVSGQYKKLLRHKIIEKFGGVTLDKYRYQDIIKYLITDFETNENVYPTVIPQWDRSARSGRRAVIYTDSTPELFRKHLDQAIKAVEKKQDDHKIIFLKSWNEWAEGNYVEPDLKYGHEYLSVLRDLLL